MRAAIVLAAGASRRFGRRDKLHEPLGGMTLIDRALVYARRCGARRIVLVGAPRTRSSGAMVVRRAPRGEALGASLAIGLAALRPIEREVVILLADMPFADPPRLRLVPSADAVRPRTGTTPGHPVLVRTHAARAGLRHGDGLGAMPRQRDVRGTPAHILDVDTPADLRRARLVRRRWDVLCPASRPYAKETSQPGRVRPRVQGR